MVRVDVRLEPEQGLDQIGRKFVAAFCPEHLSPRIESDQVRLTRRAFKGEAVGSVRAGFRLHSGGASCGTRAFPKQIHRYPIRLPHELDLSAHYSKLPRPISPSNVRERKFRISRPPHPFIKKPLEVLAVMVSSSDDFLEVCPGGDVSLR